MFLMIRDFEGEIPALPPKTAATDPDMNLNMAKYLADKYLKEVLYDILKRNGWFIRSKYVISTIKLRAFSIQNRKYALVFLCFCFY